MIGTYLQMLEDSLKQKCELLDRLVMESNRQAEIVKAEKVDWTAFDESVEEKGRLIEELEKLDQGFDTVYDRIKEGLEEGREKYKNEILKMQELIRGVTEKSSNLMAVEQRNKQLVTNRFAEEKKKFSNQKVNAKVATNYYNSMNRINYVDPQLMDKKK
ncbi:MAG: flagellar protein FliT [Lachnospiraceae bacterium]